jgi:hypothetical protein
VELVLALRETEYHFTFLRIESLFRGRPARSSINKYKSFQGKWNGLEIQDVFESCWDCSCCCQHVSALLQVWSQNWLHTCKLPPWIGVQKGYSTPHCSHWSGPLARHWLQHDLREVLLAHGASIPHTKLVFSKALRISSQRMTS